MKGGITKRKIWIITWKLTMKQIPHSYGPNILIWIEHFGIVILNTKILQINYFHLIWAELIQEGSQLVTSNLNQELFYWLWINGTKYDSHEWSGSRQVLHKHVRYQNLVFIFDTIIILGASSSFYSSFQNFLRPFCLKSFGA